MRDNVQDLTFKEVYELNGYILNISVCSSTTKQLLLCNYKTTPDVLIWSACCASGAIPVVFEACELFSKNKNGNIERY
jgi:TAG lipase/lysophosphatidylethanolamine acyltransferase